MSRTFLAVSALVALFPFPEVQARVLPCGSCEPNGKAFTLTVQPIAITNNSAGNTTSAQLEVRFANHFSADLDLVTVPFAIGSNSSNVSSLTDIDAVAFAGVWDQSCSFPGNCRIEVGLSPITPAKVFPVDSGRSYDFIYRMDHTGLGSSLLHPVQTIPVGGDVAIMTIDLTFDGTQAFQIDDSAGSDFLIRPENFLIFYGSCQDPDPTVLNRWGFEDFFGHQLLVDCFDSTAIAASVP